MAQLIALEHLTGVAKPEFVKEVRIWIPGTQNFDAHCLVGCPVMLHVVVSSRKDLKAQLLHQKRRSVCARSILLHLPPHLCVIILACEHGTPLPISLYI